MLYQLNFHLSAFIREAKTLNKYLTAFVFLLVPFVSYFFTAVTLIYEIKVNRGTVIQNY
jgi:hypothetical protein